MKHRFLNRVFAWWANYFWLPCPVCGRCFGGHEWKDIPGHQNSLPVKIYRGGSHATGICPDCTKLGVGDRAWEKAYKEFHDSGLDMWVTTKTELLRE